MRVKLIAGNWKMHTDRADAKHLATAVAAGVGQEDRVSVVICPPFPYLDAVKEILNGSRVALGAQNLYPEKEGAFTGEVSPTMLVDLGCKYVILGHRERRHKLGESDVFINQKVRVALSAGLNVILCVGETLEQREANQTETLLERQLTQGLASLPADTLTRLSIAYEPVWAIGNSGHHATPQQAGDAHAVIRRRFGQLFGKEAARALIIHQGPARLEPIPGRRSERRNARPGFCPCRPPHCPPARPNITVVDKQGRGVTCSGRTRPRLDGDAASSTSAAPGR